MKLNELMGAIKTIKKGTFVNIVYKSEKIANGITYTKVSEKVVRLGINYGKIKGVVAKGCVNPNEQTLNSDYGIKYNINTKNTCIKVYTTQNEKHKGKTTYYANGVEIDKTDYENVIKPKGSPTLVYSVNIDNIIKIGK